MEFKFGKWNGHKMSDPEVPIEYLRWLRDTNVETAAALDAELARREQLETENLTWAHRIVRAGFATMSKEFRADRDALHEIKGALAALEDLVEQYFDQQGRPKVEEIKKKRGA